MKSAVPPRASPVPLSYEPFWFCAAGAMHVIVTARLTMTPGYEGTLQRLVGILGVIYKNPEFRSVRFREYIRVDEVLLLRRR